MPDNGVDAPIPIESYGILSGSRRGAVRHSGGRVVHEVSALDRWSFAGIAFHQCDISNIHLPRQIVVAIGALQVAKKCTSSRVGIGVDWVVCQPICAGGMLDRLAESWCGDQREETQIKNYVRTSTLGNKTSCTVLTGCSDKSRFHSQRSVLEFIRRVHAASLQYLMHA